MSQQVKVYRDLQFYYGGDKTLEFNSDTSSTIVYVLPKTDATEYLAFGNGTLNMDVKFFGNAATNYMLWDESAGSLTFAGDVNLAVGSRTSGSAADLSVVEEGLLVAAQYTDGATLINTTDYVGCAAIFDLKLGRAITLASGGGYGFATIWANLEVDKAINATGGQSTAWMTIWADAAGDDAHIRGTSRLQVLDLAIVTGADFDLGTGCMLYGLRIDSSVNASATITGNFYAINIEAAGTKKDWTTGIDINDAATAIDTGTCAIILDAQPAVATTGKAIYIAGTVASPAATDGHIAYFDVTYSGTVSGLTRNVGIWTNLATGAVWSGYAHFVLDVGFYHGDNDFAGDLYLLNLSYQCSSTSTPGTVAMIRANCDTPQPPDYFILFENDEAGAITRSDPGTTFEAYIKVRGNEDSRDYAIPLVLL